MPPLNELPQLQVLRLQRNQITSNFQELQRRAASLRELDISRNRLQWRQAGGEFEAGMAVLAKLKRLKDLRFAGNPVRPNPRPNPNQRTSLSPNLNLTRCARRQGCVSC